MIRIVRSLAVAVVCGVLIVGCGAGQSNHRAAGVPNSKGIVAPKSSAAAGTQSMVMVPAAGLDTRGARVRLFMIASRLNGETIPELVVTPAGSAMRRRPLLVLLHPLVDDWRSTLTDAMFAALARLGPAAPDIVIPYSPTDSYWHDRAGQPPNYETRGAWGSYVVSEVIPRAIALLHADPRRIAIAGDSMGGFGALDIARLYPGMFCAVAAHSPALFSSYSYSEPHSHTESAPGNFDNAGDFARHDLLIAAAAGLNLYGRTQVWIDAGSRDWHVAADRTLARLLRKDGSRVQFHVWPGEHDEAYWESHENQYFHFYATALSHCPVT
jgi:enterochelin esterase-like enzyme